MDLVKKQKQVQSHLEKEIAKFVHSQVEEHTKGFADRDKIRKEEKQVVEQCVQAADQYLGRIQQAVQLLADAGLLAQAINQKQLEELLAKKDPSEILNGGVPQKQFGLSNEKLLEFYEYGSEFFKKEAYEEASNIYLFLTLLNPLIASFWVGLGMAEEMKQEYDAASLAYLMALDVNGEDLQPAIYCAQCLVKSGQPEKAKQFLEYALKEAEEAPLQSEFKKQAIQLQRTI